VALSVDGVAVGTAEADQDGSFTTTVVTSAIGAGDDQVAAECGQTLAAPLRVVAIVSQVGAGPGVMMVFVFVCFLLLTIWMYVRGRAPHPNP
jgi:hypothetical protein